jgi:AcrR family transcriptional regulator
MAKRAYFSEVRTAKAAATRERIRQAAVEIHRERLWDDFTLEDVARRAETTVQTVLRIYGSKQALALLSVEAAIGRGRASSRPGDIAAAVRVVFDDYAEIGDQVIGYLAAEPLQPALTPQIQVGRDSHRRWVETVFAPQLAARRGGARDRLLHGLIAATDVYTWKLLVRDHRLGRDRAEAVVKAMIEALIEGGRR